MGVYGSPIIGTWENDEFGTIVEMLINSDWTKFGVYRTNSIAPSPVKKFTFLKVISF